MTSFLNELNRSLTAQEVQIMTPIHLKGTSVFEKRDGGVVMMYEPRLYDLKKIQLDLLVDLQPSPAASFRFECERAEAEAALGLFYEKAEELVEALGLDVGVGGFGFDLVPELAGWAVQGKPSIFLPVGFDIYTI